MESVMTDVLSVAVATGVVVVGGGAQDAAAGDGAPVAVLAMAGVGAGVVEVVATVERRVDAGHSVRRQSPMKSRKIRPTKLRAKRRKRPAKSSSLGDPAATSSSTDWAGGAG